VADDPVVLEPVSARNSLLTGKLTGNFGEVAIAFVVLDGACDQHEEIERAMINRIAQHCCQSLAKFKQPREIIITSSLPKIGNNKINHPALRELAMKSAVGSSAE
jgi:acyl-coenzyme A synthetase/AMP-(fatty) acid ligase